MKKIIILDFDGVFYSSVNQFKYVPEYINNHRKNFLPHLNQTQYEMVCNQNPNFVKAISGQDVAREIYVLKKKYPQFKISTKDFWNVQQQYIYNIFLDDANLVDAKQIEKVCKKYTTYIVSNSSPNHIKFYMQKFGVNPRWFKRIYSNHFFDCEQTKKYYYNKIITKEEICPNQAIVFGDSEKTDLVPARELGMHTVLVKDASQLYDLITKNV